MNKLRNVVLLVSGSMIILIACSKPVRIKYNDVTERMTPMVVPGDVIKFGTSVDWISGHPCKEPDFGNSQQKVCTITSGTMKHSYTYSCHGVNCDPDVVVDDSDPSQLGGPTQGIAVTTAAGSALDLVDMYCSSNSASGSTGLYPEPRPVRVGERLKWYTDGDYPLQNWVVTLQNNDATVCQNGTYQFKQGGPVECDIVHSAPATIKYSVSSDQCGPPSTADKLGTITITP